MRQVAFYANYSCILIFYRLEIFFSYTTNRANPIFRNIFECSSRSDTTFRITYFRIVNPIANCANVLFHNCLALR